MSWLRLSFGQQRSGLCLRAATTLLSVSRVDDVTSAHGLTLLVTHVDYLPVVRLDNIPTGLGAVLLIYIIG